MKMEQETTRTKILMFTTNAGIQCFFVFLCAIYYFKVIFFVVVTFQYTVEDVMSTLTESST